MKINFNHMGSNNIIDFDIKLIKDTELSNNFIQNIRNYTNSSIFNFDDSCGALFLGDYLNNNGTANYTVNHSLLEVKHKLSNFIPANSISMIGIKQENGLFIGSQFIINFFNITDKNFINKYNIIPFGTFSIENDESKIYSFIQNYFNKNKNIKPKIVFINESNLLQNNDLLL